MFSIFKLSDAKLKDTAKDFDIYLARSEKHAFKWGYYVFGDILPLRFFRFSLV